MDKSRQTGDLILSVVITEIVIPSSDYSDSSVDQAAQLAEVFPGAKASPIDWIRFGQLRRHELGWDDTYPAYPDFPELRDTP
jgi:hypothetical protein